MTAHHTASPSRGFSGSGRAVGVAFLAVLILGLHGRALEYGLFMDDYAHVRQLRECDWSVAGLSAACRLELVGGSIELWWLPDCTLRFFRPVAFGLMKLTYMLVGWSPRAMHLASLGWHLAACTLLMFLLRRMRLGPWLATATAGLFAIHPAHVATVQWIASQSELMVTTFLLAGVLCYASFRGWPADAEDVVRGSRRGGHWGWAIACLGFFLLALGCRESALLFPVVVVAVERWCRRPRTRGAIALGIVLLLAGAGYLAMRWHHLGGAALPPRPYVVPPGDPDFLRYVFDKACYYLLGEFLLVPCVPIGGLPYLRAHPVMFYGLALMVVVLVAIVAVCSWRDGTGLPSAVWLLGFLLPVLPVFEAPHHLYLPGVGWAMVTGLLLRGVGGVGPQRATRPRRWRRAAMWTGTLAAGGLFAGVTFFFGVVFDTAQRVEDSFVDDVIAARPELRDGDTLYVANLPMIAHYVKLAVEERTGLRGLRVIGLTWAPRLLGLVGTATPSELTWVDERTIEVRVEVDRYLAGPVRRLVAAANGGVFPLRPGQRLRAAGCTVELIERDARGVQALRFYLDSAPGRSGVHLLWGSRSCWALGVHR